MIFCKICQNMYYIGISEDGNTLKYHCRNCGDVYDGIMDAEHLCVSKTYLKSNEHVVSNYVNEYTKLDPTLLRVNTLACPNESCITNEETYDINNREIILIRSDTVNVKYIYLCAICDQVWKN